MEKQKCPLRCCQIRNPHRDDCKIKVARAKQRMKEREEKRKQEQHAVVAEID